jgi:hypothetical protein
MAKERKRLINEDLVSDVPTAVVGSGTVFADFNS